jgi:tetratricopeptide (TPR) repeat protein
MTRIRILITCSVLISFFTECSRENKNEPESHPKAFLQDSVKKLDSLASILLFKDNSLALKYANTAIEISRKIRSTELLARSMNVKGIVFSANQYDSAFACFTEALSLTGGPGTESEKAHMLYNLSQLYFLANDYKNTVTLLDSSIRTGLKYKNHRAVASSLIALGNVYFVTEDYANAKNIYDSALRTSSRYSLKIEMAVALANLAKFGEDETASKSMLRQAISLLSKTKGTEEELVTTEIT